MYNPMRLMIVEDDEQDRREFIDYAKTIPDKISFVSATNSSTKALENLYNLKPEGVLLDLELNLGEGSGMEFLEGLKKYQLDYKPIIITTTNTNSSVVYNLVRNLGVDFIFYKQQAGYSIESVIDTMLMLHGSTGITPKLTTPQKTKVKIVDDILDAEPENLAPQFDPEKIEVALKAEFDAIGMGRQYKGYRYLIDTISLMITGDEGDDSVVRKIAAELDVAPSTITRGMQTVIDNTWDDCEPEVLSQQYRVYLGKKTSPNHAEFIHYYADKIRQTLKESTNEL